MSTPRARRAALQRFAADFERGAYWDAHEQLEALWTTERQALWQALVQLAAVFVLLGSDRPAGARRVLARARAKLQGVPASLHGVDVAWVRARMDALDARLGDDAPDPKALASLFERLGARLSVEPP